MFAFNLKNPLTRSVNALGELACLRLHGRQSIALVSIEFLKQQMHISTLAHCVCVYVLCVLKSTMLNTLRMGSVSSRNLTQISHSLSLPARSYVLTRKRCITSISDSWKNWTCALFFSERWTNSQKNRSRITTPPVFIWSDLPLWALC